jgi:predicted alpha/beta hydrolase
VLQQRIAVAALVTLAGGDIHYRNWAGNGAGRVLLMAWLVAGLSRLPGAVPGQYLGLGGPQAPTLMREWSGIIRGGSFERVAGSLPRGPAVPSLCIAFEGDFMAPGASVAALAELLGAELRALPVDWPGNPHASWARHPDATLCAIEAWLEEGNLVAGLRGTADEP